MKPEIIAALDVPTADDIPPIVDSIGDSVSYYKVGLEIFTAEGPACLDYLKSKNKQIFLDLKLHDIPRTVANAVTSAAQHNVSLLTVHACGGRAMLEAAAEAARESGTDMKLIAVTTLTSLDENDFTDLGITRTLSQQANALGELAISSGIDGLVTSVHEVETLRATFGPDALLVTPGIRPAGGDVADQKRVATPAIAVERGSSYLVIGRPILQADDPAAAAKAIQEEIDSAC
ncbi:orotidine 5'-phosphate decarboxylase [bacterium E08(2017)]|nr:orotidine 5'-phosphate decarboxylase [bacterium E08(2017)]